MVLVGIITIGISLAARNYWQETGSGWTGKIVTDITDTDVVRLYIDPPNRGIGYRFYVYHRGGTGTTHSDVEVKAFFIYRVFDDNFSEYEYDSLTINAKASAESTWHVTEYQLKDSLHIITEIDTSKTDTIQRYIYHKYNGNFNSINVRSVGTSGQNDSGSVIYFILDYIEPLRKRYPCQKE